MSVLVRKPFDYDVDAVSRESGLECKDESRTVQSQEDEANINSIVNRFLKTGVLPESFATPRQMLEDVTDVNNEYHAAWNLVAAARDSFMMLPAEVRARFDNDPGLYFDFVESNPDVETIEKLGLGRKDAEKVAAAVAGAGIDKGGAPEGARAPEGKAAEG